MDIPLFRIQQLVHSMQHRCRVCLDATGIHQVFVSENVQCLEAKFSIYLNRRVFVMCDSVFSSPVRKYKYSYSSHHSFGIGLAKLDPGELRSPATAFIYNPCI